jgi:hypothetical protein
MDAIEYVDEAGAVPNSCWVPFFAGLIAAGGAACIVCQLPLSHSLPEIGLVLLATGYVAAMAITSEIATRCAGSILPDRISRVEASRLIRLELLAVVWFPLLILLFREDSPWVIVIATVVAATLTKVILRIRTSNESSSAEVVDDLPQLKFLQLPDSTPLIRGLFPLICVAICLQIGFVTVLTNHFFKSAALFGISSSLLTWRVSVQSIQAPGAGARALAGPSRIRLICILSILVTFMVLAPYGLKHRLGMRLHGYLDGQVLLRAIVPLEHRVHVELPKTSYSGVILWPVQKKPRKIVAPSPASHLFTGAPRANILKIPFNGVYWYFKAPDTRPEEDAHIQHGSPTKLDVRSTDWLPILMEARQNLATPIDLNCCSQIRVAIQNADNRPGKIALAVILTNTTLPGKSSVFLGQSPVVSSHAIEFSINRPPVSEVLDFRIPENSKIRQFNQITVLFQPDPERALAGAKIAIQEFALVPRGL